MGIMNKKYRVLVIVQFENNYGSPGIIDFTSDTPITDEDIERYLVKTRGFKKDNGDMFFVLGVEDMTKVEFVEIKD